MSVQSIVAETPALVTLHHRLGCYTVGSSRFTYDVHDPESRHEAHQAACAEMRRQNGGIDPLAERLLGPTLRIRNGMVSRKGAGR
jgi:hypothetical protein